MGWKTMKTAPKDGRAILVRNRFRTRVANWTDSGWAFYQSKPGAPIAVMMNPTHWHPLPKFRAASGGTQ